MGFRAQQYVKHLTGLEPVQRLILYEISAWCMDDTGSLQWTKEHLASTCGIAFRTFERHFKVLTDLRLVLWSKGGFCLIAYWEKQNPGAQIDRQIDRQNGGAYKEGTRQNPSDFHSPKELKPSSIPAPEKRARVTAEIKAKVWAPVLGKLRRLREGVPRFRGFNNYESLELLELGEEVVIGCPVELDDGERMELALAISRAAIETGMSRGRKLSVVYTGVIAGARSP